MQLETILMIYMSKSSSLEGVGWGGEGGGVGGGGREAWGVQEKYCQFVVCLIQ